MKRIILSLLASLLFSTPAFADLKLSGFSSGGAYNPNTDVIVAVRNGTTDVLVTGGTTGTLSGLQPCTTDGTKAASNSTIIQAGLTAAGNVYIPFASSYCNAQTLVGVSNTMWNAVPGTKIINIAGVLGPVFTNATHSAPGDSNISVNNIFFDGNKTGNSTAAFATVWMYYGNNYRFTNDRFDGGVRLVSFPNGTFGEGLRFHNVTNSYVSNSDARNNLYDGFKIVGGGDNVMVNNTAADNGRCGVQIGYDNYNNGGALLPTPTSLTQSYRNTVANLVVDNVSATPSSVSPETCGVYVHGSSSNTITNITANNVNQLFGTGDSSSYNNFSNSNAKIVSDGVHAALAMEPIDTGFTSKYNTLVGINLSAVSGANGIIAKTFVDTSSNLFADITFELGGGTGTWSVVAAGTNNRFRNIMLPTAYTLTDTGTSTNIFDVGTTRGVNSSTGPVNGASKTVTVSASAFTIDASTGNTFSVTLNGATITANAPTNPIDGQKLTIQLTQDATGSRLVTWNSAFSFGTAGAPTLTTTASKMDVVQFTYNSTLAKWVYTGAQFGF